MDRNKMGLCARLFGKFLKIGAFTFGGGYAMIPLIRREIAQKEERLSALREETCRREGEIDRLNREKLELEGQRVKATRESQSRNEDLLRMEGEVSRLEQRRVSASMEEKQLLDKLWEKYELSHEAAKQQRVAN